MAINVENYSAHLTSMRSLFFSEQSELCFCLDEIESLKG